MLAKTRSPFTAQIDIAIDYNTVNGLVDFLQQSSDTRQFSPVELTRPVITDDVTFNHPFGRGMCITPIPEQDKGQIDAASRQQNR